MIPELLGLFFAYGSVLLGITVLVFGLLTRRWRLLVLFGLAVQISLFLLAHQHLARIQGSHETMLEAFLMQWPINLGGLVWYCLALLVGWRTAGKSGSEASSAPAWFGLLIAVLVGLYLMPVVLWVLTWLF